MTRERARRFETGIHAETVEHIGDAELNNAAISGKLSDNRHGMRTEFNPIVVFNKFRFKDN